MGKTRQRGRSKKSLPQDWRNRCGETAGGQAICNTLAGLVGRVILSPRRFASAWQHVLRSQMLAQNENLESLLEDPSMKDTVLISGVLSILTAWPISAGTDVADYIKEGMLKHPLEILDVQGGFAGFTGILISVQPTGEWKRSSVALKKSKVLEEGKLTEKQMAQLARDLAKYDLLHLTDHGKNAVNPHNVSITFGKHTSELRLGTSQKLPEPGDSVAGRYSGIVRAVQDLCKGKAEDKK
jgi:hypothetical protein